MMEMREIIKEGRLELRLTMKEVADHAGVSSPANIDGAPQHCLRFPAKKYKENIKKVLTRY